MGTPGAVSITIPDVAKLEGTDQPLAVIDVGSNSGRVVVFRVRQGLHLEILADARAALGLARDLGTDSLLSEGAIERTVGAIRDFRAIAACAGATRTVAVGTSAVRESENGDELVRRIKEETGLTLKVIPGDAEARFAFKGTVASLPVHHGLVADIGGGSLELSRFHDRQAVQTWTLPLGALRLSGRFLRSDPPAPDELGELRAHVGGMLEEAGLGSLTAGEVLAGTGGTIRNLAKADRRSRPYPIPRLHGYVLTAGRVDGLVEALASRRLTRRRSMAGMSSSRADSIVGGGIVLQETMRLVEAAEVVVSGQGLREGVALEALRAEPVPPQAARRASVEALVRRFAEWDAKRAERRVLIASHLLDTLDPEVGPNVRERVKTAAFVLDVGRSVDFYERYEHAADIVTTGDLAGFTHRKIALLAAVVRQGDDEGMRVKAYAPLLGSADSVPVARAATILNLADEIEQRTKPRQMGSIGCEVRGGRVVLHAPVFDPWRGGELAGRVRRVFGKSLRFAWEDGKHA